MLGLEEQRIALQDQLDALHQQLSALKDRLFDAPTTGSAKVGAKAPVKVTGGSKGRSKRGALKEQILAALSGAGDGGVRVTELASVLGTKAANIYAWFHSTGKKIPGLIKDSGGHYRLKGGAPSAKSATPAAKSSAPANASAKARPQKGKPKGAKRGELSENIIRALGAAGDKGLKIKELADQVEANYRNVSVWFVTTGKKFPKVKKVGPAHYKLAA